MTAAPRRSLVSPEDAANLELLENAHPSDWVNPEPAPLYDLVVVGAGTAGLVAASGAAGLGAKVALVERHLMGGDCLNYGCVPSKALLRCARAVEDVRRAADFGVVVPAGARADFPRIMERMRRLRARIAPNDSARRFKAKGADVFLGDARFAGRSVVEVEGKKLRFKKALIATGARAEAPPIPGLAETGYRTNETVFSLTELPRRLLVLGGGPIGCELAQAFARFGSAVTLVHTHERVLPREDEDAAACVERALAKDGVRLILSARPVRAERRGPDKVLHVEAGGAAFEFAADELLVGAGRAPNIEGLGLEAAGVEYDAREGVRVDDFLRTTHPRIYAAGDVCSERKFTHLADFQARLALQNALFLGRRRASSLVVPWCTYTDPEVARVGLSERDAREGGVPFRTFVQKLEDVDRAILDGEEEGFVKVLVREGTDRLLGASIVARHAGDLISELTLAMTGGLGLTALGRAIHPYPTQAEAVRRLGDQYSRTRLTPWVQSALGRWLALSRRL